MAAHCGLFLNVLFFSVYRGTVHWQGFGVCSHFHECLFLSTIKSKLTWILHRLYALCSVVPAHYWLLGYLLQEFILNQDWNDPKSQLQQCCLTLRTEGKEPDIPLYKWVFTAHSPSAWPSLQVMLWLLQEELTTVGSACPGTWVKTSWLWAFLSLSSK